MAAQVWPCSTKWNLLQLLTIPDWIGAGVTTPFPGRVVVLLDVVLVDCDDVEELDEVEEVDGTGSPNASMQ